MNEYAKELLTEELARRKHRNPFYSLRAFARDLGINRTTLSDVLGNKRYLSKQNAQRLIDSLALPEPQQNKLLARAGELSEEDHEYYQVLEDTFKVISHWYYLAILNLARLPGNKASPKWIANRLGIEVEQAELALDRLQRLNFIEVKQKKMYRTVKSLQTSVEVPSSVIRNYHHEILDKAKQALHQVPLDFREFSSSTVLIDLKQLPEAKRLLKKFRTKLSTLLEKGEATEVYNFSYQIFPLTQLDVDQELQG